MTRNMSTRSPEFPNLYIHNIVTATRESFKERGSKKRKLKTPRKKEPKKKETYQRAKSTDIHKASWMTAEDTFRAKNYD